jgi:hypothetical protein
MTLSRADARNQSIRVRLLSRKTEENGKGQRGVVGVSTVSPLVKCFSEPKLCFSGLGLPKMTIDYGPLWHRELLSCAPLPPFAGTSPRFACGPISLAVHSRTNAWPGKSERIVPTVNGAVADSVSVQARVMSDFAALITSICDRAYRTIGADRYKRSHLTNIA